MCTVTGMVRGHCYNNPAQIRFSINVKKMSNKDTTTKTTSGKWQWFLWGAASTLVVTMIFDEVVGLSKIRKGFANLEPEPTIITTPTPGPQSTPSEQTLAGNEAILKNARVSLQFLQAYGFNRAIAEAGQVEPNAPLYSEAREDITRWSKTILDIALGRAADGNHIDAIGTAQLVPEDDPSAYVRAQQLIEQWKIQIGREKINSALLAAAKGLINPQLASSYHRGIAILVDTPPVPLR